MCYGNASTSDHPYFDFFDELAPQTETTIEQTEMAPKTQQANDDLIAAYDVMIAGLTQALELRNAETVGHSQRVTELTIQLAQALGVDDSELVNLRRGAMLHDIGKMAVPDEILQKHGPLTHEEYNIMQMHTTFAYDMFSSISFLKPALDIPYCHHEKWDGTGYPRGLKGEEIPFAARIFAVVDVYDTLRSKHPCRRRWTDKQIYEYLFEQSGKHFDPKIVDVFLNEVLREKNYMLELGAED